MRFLHNINSTLLTLGVYVQLIEKALGPPLSCIASHCISVGYKMVAGQGLYKPAAPRAIGKERCANSVIRILSKHWYVVLMDRDKPAPAWQKIYYMLATQTFCAALSTASNLMGQQDWDQHIFFIFWRALLSFTFENISFLCGTCFMLAAAALNFLLGYYSIVFLLHCCLWQMLLKQLYDSQQDIMCIKSTLPVQALLAVELAQLVFAICLYNSLVYGPIVHFFSVEVVSWPCHSLYLSCFRGRKVWRLIFQKEKAFESFPLFLFHEACKLLTEFASFKVYLAVLLNSVALVQMAVKWWYMSHYLFLNFRSCYIDYDGR